MLGTMYLLKKVDQEEPIVLFYARLAFVAYILVVTSLYALLHWRITSRCDLTPVTVPLKSKSPSFKEAMEQAQKAAEEQSQTTETSEAKDEDKSQDSEDKDKSNSDEPKTETITTMEYDLRTLSGARRSWVMNCLILAAINYKTESVSAIVMSPFMTLIKLLTEDPLFLIHICGAPAVEKLKRPFPAPESPFAALFKEMAPKDPSPAKQPKDDKPVIEELHGDSESEGEDSGPTRLTDLGDDHIKSDFDEEEEPKKTK
ncbi:SRP-independent targeting protein [Gracilaria domingensis]|nr:SRP-independent targeting protein [Gracilaria domingensis]